MYEWGYDLGSIGELCGRVLRTTSHVWISRSSTNPIGTKTWRIRLTSTTNLFLLWIQFESLNNHTVGICLDR